MLSVTEHVATLSYVERSDILTQILLVFGNYVRVNYSQVLPNLTFVNFASFLETMQKPLPIKFSSQDNLIGRVNADRFVRLLDTYRRGVYDLSGVLGSLSREKNIPKFVQQLNNSVQFYLKNRIEEVPFLTHLVSRRQRFGSYRNTLTGSFGCSTIMTLEQVTYQLDYLFQATRSTPLRKESIMVEFSRFRSKMLAEYFSDWLEIWKYAFRCGLTEVVDNNLASTSGRVIYEKLHVSKLYFRDDVKRLNDVMELERMVQKHLTTFKLD